MSLEILPRHFVEKPWGQTGLPAHFGGRSESVGEIWFDRAGEHLPLLCKWLFTSEKLSVQVHPDNTQAAARGLQSGKEECWIVTAAEPDARLGIGLTRSLSDDELREASLSGEIETLLDWKPVKPGDWFYIPAGTIHAIGAGVQLVEIQQNADITYRLYDYGRPRELHLDEGVAVSRAEIYDGPHGTMSGVAGLHRLFEGPFFDIHYLNGTADLYAFGDANGYFVPVRGRYRSSAGSIEVGDTAYGPVAEVSGGNEGDLLLIATAR